MAASSNEDDTASGGLSKPWETAKDGPGSGADPLAARFVESLSWDRRLHRHDITGSIAHARMLEQRGLIDADELGQIERGLTAIGQEIAASGDDWPGWQVELEDVHMCIESALIERIGDAGRKLHTGRSRNDQVALDLKLWSVDAAEHLDGLLSDLCRALVTLAGRDGRIVMPAYTHLQRAQPIVAGCELLAWVAAFDRARRRIAVLGALNAENPLGSGAIAGSALPLDRRNTARELGIGPPTASSIDATATRDVAVDLVYGLAMVGMTLSRWAEQWILYASSEFGFIRLDPRYTTGSSMMPQKQNPDMLELIRGRTGALYGHLVALLTMCKGLPLGYNRDLQEDKRSVFAAYDLATDALAMATRIVSTVRFDADVIGAGLDRGHLDATGLAEYLVTRGVPFRLAHQVVGALVRRCGSRPLADLPLEAFNTACADAGLGEGRCDEDLFTWLGPANLVRRYRTAGSGGLIGLRQQLRRWERKLGLA